MEKTALYRFYDAADVLLYVGITCNPDSRWKGHASDKPWWPLVTRKSVEWFEDRDSAEVAERRAIQNEHPLHNVHHVGTEGDRHRPKRSLQPTPWWSYVRRISSNASAAQIGRRMGLAHTSVTRWQDGTPKAESIAVFCQAYGRPVVEGMVAAGYVPAEEVPSFLPVDLSTLSDEEIGLRLELLGAEVVRRARR